MQTTPGNNGSVHPENSSTSDSRLERYERHNSSLPTDAKPQVTEAANPLRSESKATIEMLAQASGNHLSEVERVAADDVRMKQGGAREDVERRLKTTAQEIAQKKELIKEAERTLAYERPSKVESRRPLGMLGVVCLLFLVSALVLVLWIENTGASLLLISLGAFGLQSSDTGLARMMVATPIAPALAMLLALPHLPLRVQRLLLILACGMVTIAFLAWVGGFAVQLAHYSDESGGGFFQNATEATVNASGFAGYAMFGALLTLLAGTTFLGHAGADSYLKRYEILIPNPAFIRAEDARYDAQHAIHKLSEELSDLEKKLAAYRAEENQAVSHGRALYKAKKFSPPVVILAVCSLLGSIVGCNPSPSFSPTSGSVRTSKTTKQHLAIVLCSSSSSELQNDLLSQLEKEFSHRINLEPGTQCYVLDAWTGSEITRASVVPGASRIRKNTFRQPAGLIHEWITKKSRLRTEERVHLPRIVQTIAQLDPPPVHAIVIGAPLLMIEEGPDKIFCMKSGHVPSDGMMLVDSSQSVYSTLTLKDKLPGVNWHFGWTQEGDNLFLDDTHRQKTLRFWHLYLRELGGRLITAQGSMSSAFQAARDGLCKPLMDDELDRNAPPAMLKYDKIVDPITDLTRIDSVVLAQTRLPKQDIKEETKESMESSGTAAQFEKQISAIGPNSQERIQTNNRGQIAFLRFMQDTDTDHSPLLLSLARLDYKVDLIDYPLPPQLEFESRLHNASQIWLWSSNGTGRLPEEHRRAIVQRWEAGASLCLLADNQPYCAESNELLKHILPGVSLEGNCQGQRFLRRYEPEHGTGFDNKSSLFSGIQLLWEGSTVSRIVGYENTHLMPVCFNSEGGALIALMPASNGKGGLVVDCGFTRYYERYFTPLTDRLLGNIVQWFDSQPH